MVVASGTALFAAAVLTGCGSDPEPDHQAVCVNQTTQTRVDDDDCDDNGGARVGGGGVNTWLLYGSGRRYPPIGGKIASYPGGVTTLPSGHAGAYGGAEAKGGTVSKASAKTAIERGGFGKTSRSSGSVGG
ncbi:hypothetical protein Kisp01_50470 [Kineosporia sp. NBRC 101677]|nr:hypothetical protein Kisp01_50470 [Kineosporia sp. NBRC 101677]